MDKKKIDLLHDVGRIVKLIVLIGLAATVVTTALTFFAKAKTVQMLDQRLGLNISQDIVNSKKADVQWMKQQVVMQRKEGPPTPAELEIIKKGEVELEEAKELHKGRVKDYEAQHKQKF